MITAVLTDGSVFRTGITLKEKQRLFCSYSYTLRLRYKGYFGGVTALTKDQFRQVNGFSNTYWGWGGEDDDLRIRWDRQK